jgi:hypothetical protein
MQTKKEYYLLFKCMDYDMSFFSQQVKNKPHSLNAFADNLFPTSVRAKTTIVC